MLRWTLVAVLFAVAAFIVFDIFARHQKTLRPSAELDLYMMGVYSPAQHADEFRPKGYVYSVHYTAFQVFRDSLDACRVFNLLVYFTTAGTAFLLLRNRTAVFAAFVLAMASPRMLECAISAAPDFAATCAIFLVWMLAVAHARASTRAHAWYALLAGVALTVWACSLRMQSSIVLLFSAITVAAATRFTQIPTRVGRYLLAVAITCTAMLPVFRAPGAWKNVAAAIMARWDNRVWPDVGRIFWDPSFPQDARAFFALDGAWVGATANWFFNAQSGILRYLFVWPTEFREFAYPPILSLTLLIVVIAVWKRSRHLSSSSASAVLERNVVFALFSAHVLTYTVFCAAFLTDRFVLYALPITAYFLTLYLQLETRATARRAVCAFLVVCVVASLWNLRDTYCEWLNPYSSTYVQLTDLPLPMWSVEQRERLRPTPSFVHLEARPLINPLVQVRLETIDRAVSYDYDLLFNYIPPSHVNAPERSRLFLPRVVAADPGRYVLRFIDRGERVLEVPLSTATLRHL